MDVDVKGREESKDFQDPDDGDKLQISRRCQYNHPSHAFFSNCLGLDFFTAWWEDIGGRKNIFLG